MYWVLFVLTFQGFRFHLWFEFRHAFSGSTGLSEFLNAAWTGFRFDSAISAVLLLVPFLVTSLWSCLAATCLKQNLSSKTQPMINDFQRWVAIFYAVLIAILCSANIPFYKEYNESYNQFVFEALYDDPVAIFKTAVHQSSPLLYGALAVLVACVLVLLIKKVDKAKFYLQSSNKKRGFGFKTLITLVIILLTVGACRGGFDKRPILRKWAAVTTDRFLNKTVINPVRSLHYAYVDYSELKSIGNENPFTHSELNLPQTDLFTYEAPGIDNPPNHIILVIMESYDAWPLMEKYQSLGLSKKLSQIANEGVHFDQFLPASKSTMNSLVSIVSGVDYTGINHSRQLTKQPKNPFSIYKHFNDLGYETYFFYGGLLSWQNVGGFISSQGAKHIYSAADAGGKNEMGTWGIDDDQLFNMVMDKLPKHQKTFSIILTTSYHGPYTVDIKSKGFPYSSWSALDPKARELIDQESMSLLEMGHLWFSDKAVGDFVQEFKTSYSDSLFAFTGDHYGRRFINGQPSLYERNAVPFIVYPKLASLAKVDSEIPGQHIDIGPTLIELAAPKSFVYRSLGKSMLRKNLSDSVYGYKVGITDGELISMDSETAKELTNDKKYQEKKALHWELAFKHKLYLLNEEIVNYNKASLKNHQ